VQVVTNARAVLSAELGVTQPTQSLIASCPSPTRRIGGGCAASFQSAFLTQSFPTGDDTVAGSWACTWHTGVSAPDGATPTFTAYALCVD
jgi:hypothetical protein